MRYFTKKKKIFIIISLIITFIILSILLFIQIHNLKVKNNDYYITTEKISSYYNYDIEENDFFFPTFEELSQFINKELELPKKSIILTIDDGNESFFTLAVPLIEKYQVPVTSFVITSECDSNKIRQYQSDYVHFESHSYNLHQAGKMEKDFLLILATTKHVKI